MSQTTDQSGCTVWSYNGNEFKLDIGDAEDAVRYEQAIKRFGEMDASRKKDGSISEVILAYDRIFRDLYDEIFGDGAGDAILGDTHSVTNCNRSYESFLEFVDGQGVSFEKFNASIVSKYGGNRAQRRAAQYGRH